MASPGPMAGEIPEAVAVIAKAGAENFPVAARAPPAPAPRRHLLAIYGFARLADDIGDEAPRRPAGPARLAGGGARRAPPPAPPPTRCSSALTPTLAGSVCRSTRFAA